jgi:hypothetical protein
MLTILSDAKRKPALCRWFGPIPSPELGAWLERSEMLLPSDLLDFWCATGGGDIFETETILRPTVPQSPNSCFVAGDDTDTQNSSHRKAGMPAGLFIFHIGSFLSAIALENQRYVVNLFLLTTGTRGR